MGDHESTFRLRWCVWEEDEILGWNTGEIPVHQVRDEHLTFKRLSEIEEELDRFGGLQGGDECSGKREVASGGFGSVGAVVVEVFEGGIDGKLAVHAGDGTVDEGA